MGDLKASAISLPRFRLGVLELDEPEDEGDGV
jgi:hypothetical protein